MTISERERQAEDAINEFIQQSCAFILPGVAGEMATEVGSGVLIQTNQGHSVVLTAKHIAESAARLEYRLGCSKCINPVNNFVAGVLIHPSEVDVALLIAKDELVAHLKDLALSPNSIGGPEEEVFNDDALVLTGFPFELSKYGEKHNTQGFMSISYWCVLAEERFDEKQRYCIEWKNAERFRTTEPFDLPTPSGISGGPLWRFRKGPPDSIWSSERIGKIVGIQVSWKDWKEIVLVEPVQKWAEWFRESLEKVDLHYK